MSNIDFKVKSSKLFKMGGKKEKESQRTKGNTKVINYLTHDIVDFNNKFNLVIDTAPLFTI